MVPKFAITLFFLKIIISGSQVNPAPGLETTDKIPSSKLKKRKVASNNQDRKVTLELYYETHCYECRIFDATIFKDTVIDLQSYLDVQVFPFGNADILGNGTIICQHGEKECYGNKLHACAIDILNNTTLSIVYNACLMDDDSHDTPGSDDEAADACGKVMEIDSEPIKQCAKGQKGEDLVRHYGEVTKKANIMYVPYVLINGQTFSPYYYDFLEQEVCKKIKNPPKQCTT